ncbi:MAG: DUF3422 domain-containing protein [Rhodobiaceae bacterium]|nr:DUF3422 domain-containing protein [Rhodobiaceae bacterium]MCC0015839.1 DUF3422 domain-containing protein [Rhodobiaceae bacterium]MCC0040624.1 DUF3422 domain-containing protein [Rhodobiaceae bacterium]MCC0054097.1 DUF3422 domain-containing protein [Rhodobiaceae bacterium]
MVERVFPAHEDRAIVLSELHARPFQPVASPRQVFHFALMTDSAGAEAHRAALERLLKLRGLPPMPQGARHHRFSLAGTEIRWEAHAEFTTWGFSVADGKGDPFAGSPPPDVREILEGLPGELVAAVRTTLRHGRKPNSDRVFDAESLCISLVDNGRARALTDLKPDTAGFIRILVEHDTLTPQSAGAVVQRLHEVETYRCLALLGLPLAHRVAGRVREIEQALADVTSRMRSASGLEANRALLEDLARLATEVEALSSLTSYRFSAAAAYTRLVDARLRALDEAATPDAPTIGAFLARRMAPAMRTCESLGARIDDLSAKLSRAANLLRARVDVELESQNRDLLGAMNRRARQQLRLQQTVEGLSVAAVSYYVVGLVGYLAKGGEKAGFALNATLATALAVPVVLAIVWLIVRSIRAHHSDTDGE